MKILFKSSRSKADKRGVKLPVHQGHREARDNFHELFPKSYGGNESLAAMAAEKEMALKLGFVQ